MDILEHIQELYPTLTKKQKTIADYLIANPEEIKLHHSGSAQSADTILRIDTSSFLPETGLFHICWLERTIP